MIARKVKRLNDILFLQQAYDLHVIRIGKHTKVILSNTFNCYYIHDNSLTGIDCCGMLDWLDSNRPTAKIKLDNGVLIVSKRWHQRI